MIRIDRAATSNASTGATRPGIATFWTIPLQITASGPFAATIAPTTPPISACDEDDGRPNHHVARFQTIAPISPANTISSVTSPALTMPVAIVAATSSDRNAPTKFSVDDIATATRGDIARVETDVATAFAVSWKPLVKSNASAVATMMNSTASGS